MLFYKSTSFLFLLCFSTLFLFETYIYLVRVLELFTNYILKHFYELESSYDYIIVGCGSAGSTVALRLAEDKNMTVLVLEAGIYGSKWFDIPAITPLLQLSAIDWQYRTVTQINAAKALNDKISNWPMGRIVGGSGRLNFMVYARGHPEDFKEWYKDDEEYDYKQDILSYFKKAEHQKGMYRNDTDFHGTSGHLMVNDLYYTTSLASSFLEAVQALGYSVTDLNGKHNTGFMQPQVNVNYGTRRTPLHHLRQQQNSNIHLRANAFVHKILFKSNYEAYGLEYSYFGDNLKVYARKGVIISAGVIGSPKLLMLSGIGPKKHLNEVGIRPILNLPVGNNLQDHVTTGSDLVLLNVSLGINVLHMFSPKSIFNYFFLSSGPWTTVGCEALGMVYTDNGNNLSTGQPDLGFMVIPFGHAGDAGVHLQKAAGFSDVTWQRYFKFLVGKTTISILPIVIHAKSKGTVRLLDKNPQSPPLINPNYLVEPYDVDIILKGIEIIKRIIKTKPMQQLGAKLNNRKFPGCENFIFDTQPYWECYVKHLTLTVYHPIGTCKMGGVNDKEAVVNFDFQVRGTNKLYLVDSSIIPSLPSSNPNAIVIMLAEKAADKIKYIQFLNHSKCHRLEIFIPSRTCLIK